MNPLSSLKSYLISAKIELEKVSWPTREQIIRYSMAIIVTSLVAALSFAALDYVFHTAVIKLIASRQANAPISDQSQTTEVIPETSLTTSTPSTVDNSGIQLTPDTQGGSVQVTPVSPSAPSPKP